MRYDDSWRPPARETALAHCRCPNCTPDGKGLLCVASTLDAQGFCAACARTADDTDRRLR